MNPRFKKLMKELENAISRTVSESDRVAHVIKKINDEGFDACLVLEATIGLSHLELAGHAARELVSTHKKSSAGELNINAHDARFLKSLRISVDDAS